MKKEEYLEFLNINEEKFSKIAVIGILHEIANNYKEQLEVKKLLLKLSHYNDKDFDLKKELYLTYNFHSILNYICNFLLNEENFSKEEIEEMLIIFKEEIIKFLEFNY